MLIDRPVWAVVSFAGMKVAGIPGGLCVCAFMAAGCPGLTGCSVGHGGSTCNPQTVMSVSPTTGVADHVATPPGNQVKFTSEVYETDDQPGCPVPESILLATPTWTSSDAKDIQIDSSNVTGLNGTATCVGATNGPATLTATFGLGKLTLTQTVTLTCK